MKFIIRSSLRRCFATSVMFVMLTVPMAGHAEHLQVGSDHIYYESNGDGFPLVLVGGGSGMDIRQWDRITSTLVESFQVVRFDPRGVGRSDNPTEIYSDADDLQDLLNHQGIKHVILIGLSSSGGFILEYSLQYPENVAGMVAAAPFVPGFEFSDSMMQRIMLFGRKAEEGKSPFLDSMFADAYFIPAPLNHSIRESARQNIGMNYDKRAGFDQSLPIPLNPPLIDQLVNIRPPVLLVAGELDHPEVHRRNDFLASQIPKTQQIMVPDAGHNAPLENPDAFLAAIRPFLDETSKR